MYHVWGRQGIISRASGDVQRWSNQLYCIRLQWMPGVQQMWNCKELFSTGSVWEFQGKRIAGNSRWQNKFSIVRFSVRISRHPSGVAIKFPGRDWNHDCTGMPELSASWEKMVIPGKEPQPLSGCSICTSIRPDTETVVSDVTQNKIGCYFSAGYSTRVQSVLAMHSHRWNGNAVSTIKKDLFHPINFSKEQFSGFFHRYVLFLWSHRCGVCGVPNLW